MEIPTNLTDRVSASNKNDGIKSSQFPIITRAAYIECSQNPSTMVDQKMRSLCLGRAGIGTALLRIDKALKDHNPQATKDGRDKPLYNALRSVRVQLEKLQIRYPLRLT